MERITEYFAQLLDEIDKSNWVIHEELAFRQIDIQEGYIKGKLYLYSGFTLHVAEYVAIQAGVPQISKYRYHLQDRDDNFIARWDNAPHHQEIPTYPFHKHCQNGEIISSLEMDIPRVLIELDDVLKNMI